MKKEWLNPRRGENEWMSEKEEGKLMKNNATVNSS